MGKNLGGQTVPRIERAEHIGPDDTGDNIEAKRVALYEATDGMSWSRSGTPLTVRLDNTADPILYLGKAPVGSSELDPVWQVSKLDTTTGLAKLWAGGDSLYTKTWSNRVSLTYS